VDGLHIEGLDAALDTDALAAGKVAARVDHVQVRLSASTLVRLSANPTFPASVERLETGKLHLKVRKGGRSLGAEVTLAVDSVGRIVAEVGAVRLGGIRLPGGLMGLIQGVVAGQLPPGVTVDCNRFTVDHREMAASRGVAVAPVRSIQVTPQEIAIEF
jgi:hypothetical protein